MTLLEACSSSSNFWTLLIVEWTVRVEMFGALIIKRSKILSLSVVTGDKAFYSEDLGVKVDRHGLIRKTQTVS
ncbi:MAG: hypothetical protein WA667_16700 [Candidatus Nitrosopolaris sp.]